MFLTAAPMATMLRVSKFFSFFNPGKQRILKNKKVFRVEFQIFYYSNVGSE
ncbi:hypothetical protein HK096_001486 [Nowakowskiella sp. JEL0078]|nr:hypothetical protein HK096_001486 [Nowakowskiella sp. JEL0078]